MGCDLHVTRGDGKPIAESEWGTYVAGDPEFIEGDDGEVYESPGGAPRMPRVSFAARVRAWTNRLRPRPRPHPVAVPFTVGQRVRDFRGQPGTVVAIDIEANQGMGRIEVLFDDGRQLTFTVIAHGLEPVPEQPWTSTPRVWPARVPALSSTTAIAPFTSAQASVAASPMSRVPEPSIEA